MIERHLSTYLEAPQVAVDVFAYNSKTYYVITQGAGQGDDVTEFPITGNETVLDAIAQLGGLSQLVVDANFHCPPSAEWRRLRADSAGQLG